MAVTKSFSTIFFVLFFASCTQSHASVDSPKFDVNPVMLGFTSKQEEKVHLAAELIRKVVASEAFKRKVLNYTYRGKKAFVENGGLTNQQIFQRILQASEKMTGLGNNRTMDLELELYTNHDSTTIGYTYPNIIRVYMNRKYFNKFKPHQVADNMMHEWLHKIGFGHQVKATPSRKHSVPYAVGYIIKSLASNHL